MQFELRLDKHFNEDRDNLELQKMDNEELNDDKSINVIPAVSTQHHHDLWPCQQLLLNKGKIGVIHFEKDNSTRGL